MVEFVTMFHTYDRRKVARDEYDWGYISTAKVIDSIRPYETAIKHKKYQNRLIIVEKYDSAEDAGKGHKVWVKRMSATVLPTSLQGVSDCDIVQMAASAGVNVNENIQYNDE